MTNATCTPASRARVDVLGGARRRRRPDIDHAVEVEHHQVVPSTIGAVDSSSMLHPSPDSVTASPYDAPMDLASGLPPYVARPLAPRSRSGRSRWRPDTSAIRPRPAPSRDPIARSPPASREWIDAAASSPDTEPALYLHEYTSGGLTVRGLVGILDVSRRAETLASARCARTRAIHPEQAGELADRMHQMALNPAPILLVHHGPPQLRSLIAQVAARRA